MSASIPLQWPEAVRRKPGMYIGGTDERALNGCVFELIANSMEEHLAGRGSSIMVTIHNDESLSVKDDGGGISVTVDLKRKTSFIEYALTTLNVLDDYLKRPYRVLGLCGVGTKCVNAVSEWMRVNTVWEGEEYQIAFTRGQISEPLRKLPKPGATRGTTVRFKPDPEIFRTTIFNRNLLATRLDYLAVLHPALEIWLVDERPNTATRPLVSYFHYPSGIADFLKVLIPPELRRHPEPFFFQADSSEVKIVLGFQFTESGNTSLASFVNSGPTQRGGTHVQGFLRGLADAFNELGKPERPFQTNDMRAGLNAIVGVWLTNPYYGGSTKDELINPETEVAVRELTSSSVKRWAAESGKWAQWLVESLDEERRAVEAEAQ